MIHQMSVTPVEAGWAVRSDLLDNELVFFSGAKAESAARKLAQHIADQRGTVELRIFLRDGSLAGRSVYAAALPLAG